MSGVFGARQAVSPLGACLNRALDVPDPMVAWGLHCARHLLPLRQRQGGVDCIHQLAGFERLAQELVSGQVLDLSSVYPEIRITRALGCWAST